MAASAQRALREQINFRASSAQRDTIDRAAKLLGRTRTDFILEAAMREAQEALLDQVHFRVSAEEFDRITELLENPPPPSAKLIELFRRKAPWE